MSRQQNRRVIANVTEAQCEAVDEALEKLMEAYSLPSKNDALIYILKGMCRATETNWPEFVPTTEGRNFKKGAGGKFVKKP